MRRSYQEMLDDRERRYGERFSTASLAAQFIPYFESGQRIKIRTSYGEVKFGTVGVTGGWVPSFLLMLRRTSMGSSILLRPDDEILAVKRGRSYVELDRPGMVD